MWSMAFGCVTSSSATSLRKGEAGGLGSAGVSTWPFLYIFVVWKGETCISHLYNVPPMSYQAAARSEYAIGEVLTTVLPSPACRQEPVRGGR